MPITYAGYQCIDPAALLRDCEDHVPPLPTDSWLGKANSFRCPTGKEPATASILLRKSDLDAILTATPVQPAAADPDYGFTYDRFYGTLLFEEDAGRQFPAKRLGVRSARCVTPGYEDDPAAAYLVELADARCFVWERFSPLAPEEMGFNTRYPDGALTEQSGAAGTAGDDTYRVTWSKMGQLLWELAFGDVVGWPAWPGLPFTPHSYPGHFDYSRRSPWEALHDYLARLACRLVWNPVTHRYSLARVAAADTAADAVIDRLIAAKGLVWSDWSADPPEPTPYRVEVLFARLPVSGIDPYAMGSLVANEPGGGSDNPHQVWIDHGSSPAADERTYSIWDDLQGLANTNSPATPPAGTLFTNQVDVEARAAERAADFTRVLAIVPTTRVFTGARPELAACLGSQWSELAVYDRGDGIKTEIVRRPWVQNLLDWRPSVFHPPIQFVWWSRGTNITIDSGDGETLITSKLGAPIIGANQQDPYAVGDDAGFDFRIRAYVSVDFTLPYSGTPNETADVIWKLKAYDPTKTPDTIVIHEDTATITLLTTHAITLPFRSSVELLNHEIPDTHNRGDLLNPVWYYSTLEVTGNGTAVVSGEYDSNPNLGTSIHAERIFNRGTGPTVPPPPPPPPTGPPPPPPPHVCGIVAGDTLSVVVDSGAWAGTYTGTWVEYPSTGLYSLVTGGSGPDFYVFIFDSGTPSDFWISGQNSVGYVCGSPTTAKWDNTGSFGSYITLTTP